MRIGIRWWINTNIVVMDADIRLRLGLSHTMASSTSASLYMSLAHIPSGEPGLAEQALKRSMSAESMFWSWSAGSRREMKWGL